MWFINQVSATISQLFLDETFASLYSIANCGFLRKIAAAFGCGPMKMGSPAEYQMIKNERAFHGQHTVGEKSRPQD